MFLAATCCGFSKNRTGRADGQPGVEQNGYAVVACVSGRASFEGSPDEVAADIRRARSLGADYLTFDMPKLDVPGMVRTMERFVKEVKPAAT